MNYHKLTMICLIMFTSLVYLAMYLDRFYYYGFTYKTISSELPAILEHPYFRRNVTMKTNLTNHKQEELTQQRNNYLSKINNFSANLNATISDYSVPKEHINLQGTLTNNKTTIEWTQEKRKKIILVYTALFGRREWYHLPEQDAKDYVRKQGCKVSNCEITYDNNRLNESDAVIFHARDMPSAGSLRDLRKQPYSSHQRWVYFISENPINTANPQQLDGIFNWTMTYKKESDIWITYQRYVKLDPSKPVPKPVNYAAEKNRVKQRKLAFWVSSHCGVFRDKLVKKLGEFISIDIAGSCGGNFKNHIQKCDRNGPNTCMERAKEYKFYLSFENAFCDQYVTEKYWYNAMQHDTVPIVLGGGPYNDPHVAVPGSFIDAQDFSTVKELADYLIYLDKNDTAYNEYFSWKQKYMLPVDKGWPYPDLWSCMICDKLHNDKQNKVYDKLSEFWNKKDCKNRDEKAVNMVNKS